MSEEDIRELIKYVANLPQPRQQLPSESQLLAAITSGGHLFTSIGCATCHMPQLGHVSGIYSDLLLHDMGTELADLGASPFGSDGYYGGGRTSILVFQPDNKKQREWRTPPLWGVRDSAPYLHDGRAATLREAIELHGGQGKEAAEKFAALDDTQDAQLMLFLDTLVAPGGEF